MTTHEQPDPDTQGCISCAYFVEMLNCRGQCRRHAPAALIIGGRATESGASWPVTFDDDWCGDFVRRER